MRPASGRCSACCVFERRAQVDMFAFTPKPVRRVCAVCTAGPASRCCRDANRRRKACLSGSNQRFVPESIPSGLEEHIKTPAYGRTCAQVKRRPRHLRPTVSRCRRFVERCCVVNSPGSRFRRREKTDTQKKKNHLSGGI